MHGPVVVRTLVCVCGGGLALLVRWRPAHVHYKYTLSENPRGGENLCLEPEAASGEEHHVRVPMQSLDWLRSSVYSHSQPPLPLQPPHRKLKQRIEQTGADFVDIHDEREELQHEKKRMANVVKETSRAAQRYTKETGTGRS